MKKDPAISVTEWMEELSKLAAKNDDGRTVAEWAEAMGVCNRTAMVTLKKAKAHGWLKLGMSRREALNGQMRPTTVYQVVKPKAGSNTPKRNT